MAKSALAKKVKSLRSNSKFKIAFATQRYRERQGLRQQNSKLKTTTHKGGA
ncbi:hypothetical protein [Trichormus variabilis]|uniref:hypothetical protein n=1 Tax=Anabaena variabilis TaxID=264691 RepID=UPI000046023A|nr:hypothetical protein [Trichormus variabilis]MBC1328297.1 hypothetical protein [Trichormus variabilis 9RC]